MRSNSLAAVFDGRGNTRLDAGVVGVGDLPGALQGHHLIAHLDGLNGLERAVTHDDALALGHAVLVGHVDFPRAWVLAVSELELEARRERPGRIARVIPGARVDGWEDALRPVNGRGQHGLRAAQVKRVTLRHAPLEAVRVARVPAALVLHHDLVDGVHEQHQALAGPGRPCPQHLVDAV